VNYVGVLRKQTVQSQGFVFALLGVFLLSLGLPQVGALHHEHPGGDHAHVHAEFADSPVVLLHTHHHEPTLPHSHPHVHHEADHASHGQHIHLHHHHHKITAKKNHLSEFAYHKPRSSRGVHWHVVNVFHHATPTHLAPLLPVLSRLSLPVFAQAFLFIPALPVSQPRAPPVLV
jgi:hypothetical protein